MSHKNKSGRFLHIRSLLQLVLGIPLTLVSLFFIGSILFREKEELLPRIAHVNIPLVILGTVFLLLFFGLKSFAWHLVLKKRGAEIPLERSLFLYSFAELRRYIPGNIFSFVSRAVLLKKESVSALESTKAMAIEAGIMIVSAVVASIPTEWIAQSTFGSQANLLRTYGIEQRVHTIGTVFLGVLGILALIVLGFVIKKFSLTPQKLFAYKEIFLVSFASWVLFGIGNYCIASSIAYVTPDLILQFSSLFVFSWLIGYLSLVTPMGLGIREAAVSESLVLFAKLSIEIASFIAIFSRVCLIFAELFYLLIIFALNKSYSLRRKLFSYSYQPILLSIFTGSYIAYFTYITFQKHDNFFTGRFDLGNMDQVVWNTLHGRIFMLTNPDSTNIISRLSIHADFILILLAPFYLIWQDPKMLLFIQSACIGLGAIFVYLLTYDILKSKTLGLVLSISYLLNPWIQHQNLYDFHGVSLATTFLLATFYFLHKKKYIWFFVFLVLSVLTKENIFLIASLFGVYLMIKRKYIPGFILTITGGILFYLLISKFIPDARGGAHFAISYFTDFGDSPPSVIRGMLLHPVLTLSKVFNQTNIVYAFNLLIHTGFLPLLSPFYLIFAAPELAINILSQNTNLKSMNFHYGAAIIPFIYISAIYGIQFLLHRKKFLTEKFFVYYLLLFALISAWSYGTLPGSSQAAVEVFTKTVPDRDVISQFISTIPSRYSVAATNNLGAHLSHRERIYTIPNGIDQADIVLFLLNDQFAQPSLDSQIQMVNNLNKDRRYTQVFEDDPFVVFTKSNVHNLQINF